MVVYLGALVGLLTVRIQSVSDSFASAWDPNLPKVMWHPSLIWRLWLAVTCYAGLNWYPWDIININFSGGKRRREPGKMERRGGGTLGGGGKVKYDQNIIHEIIK